MRLLALYKGLRVETNQEFSSIVNLPQFPGPSVVTRTNAPADPNEATALTIEKMKGWALADSTSPQVVRATGQALLLTRPHHQREYAAAIFDWVKRNCRFREDDPVLRSCLGLDNELELLIAPAQLLSMRPPSGDCDCLTTLCMSMLICAGIPAEPLTIKADEDDPTRDSHVYCQAVTEDGPFVLDPAMGCKYHWNAGDEAPGWFQKDNWGVIQSTRPKGLQGYGLGDDGSGEVDIEGSGLPGGSLDFSDIWTGGSPSIPVDWNKFLQQVTAGGLSIAKMQATPVGYVQQPSGAFANYGPGGTIPQLGGISTSTLMLGGAALLALVLFSGHK